MTEFGFRPERRPSESRTICRTSGGCPSMVKITSQERARSRGEEARTAPWDWRERDEGLEGLRA